VKRVASLQEDAKRSKGERRQAVEGVQEAGREAMRSTRDGLLDALQLRLDMAAERGGIFNDSQEVLPEREATLREAVGLIQMAFEEARDAADATLPALPTTGLIWR